MNWNKMRGKRIEEWPNRWGRDAQLNEGEGFSMQICLWTLMKL